MSPLAREMLQRGLVTGLAQVPLGLREAGLALGLTYRTLDKGQVFRSASLRRHGDLAKPVERLVARLEATTMQRLNAAVDLHKPPLEPMVPDWRQSAGLEG